MTSIALLLLAILAWSGTVTDNFDDGDMDNWALGGVNLEQATWQIKDGELVILTNPISMIGFAIGDKTWSDYTTSVRMKITEHQPLDGWAVNAGLALRGDPASGSTDSYLFDLGTINFGGKEAIAFYLDDTTRKNVVTKAFPWKFDTWYDMKVTAQGNRFEFYVDNELIIEYTHNILPSGGIALNVGAGLMEICFDDFAVTGDNIPDMDLSEGVISSIKPEVKLTTTWAKVKGFQR
jgi:hypothetical protein